MGANQPSAPGDEVQAVDVVLKHGGTAHLKRLTNRAEVEEVLGLLARLDNGRRGDDDDGAAAGADDRRAALNSTPS